MKLSVCIFTYNHEPFIAQTIEGVLAQETDFDFEIVIGEDRSSDLTRNIVQSFQEQYPQKIRALLHQRNLGMMENCSYTISQGRGEYIAVLDGDDYWTNPQKLQAQVDFLEANPEYALCFHDARILALEGGWNKETCCGSDHQKIVSFEDIICDVHIPTSSLVFRRSALGNYPPAWLNSLNAPDRPLFLLLASNGPGYYFNETWGVYRKHMGGTWTSQHYQSRWLTHLQIYRVMNEYYKKVYDTSFCRCEAKAAYTLAMELIKDNKPDRAICCLRKYIRASKGPLMNKILAYLRGSILLFHYYKCKLRLLRRQADFS
jgi:glycosyltransferase involved in cell wall biosynthesis